jgi:hypothetical protein
VFKSFLVKKAFKFEKIIEGFEAEIVKKLFLFFSKRNFISKFALIFGFSIFTILKSSFKMKWSINVHKYFWGVRT